MKLRTAGTDELDADTLSAGRALLDEAFQGEFSDHDWAHALGGLHALVYEDGQLVGHGSVVERHLVYDGRPLRVGYVEGMGVRPDRRGRGYGAAIMEALETVIRTGYELGALAATDDGARLYAKRGWVRWTGPTQPDGERAVYVLPLALPIDTSGSLSADWREGDIW